MNYIFYRISRRSFIVSCVKAIKYLLICIIASFFNYPRLSLSQDKSQMLSLNEIVDDPNLTIDSDYLRIKVNGYVDKLIESLEAEGEKLTEQEKEKMRERTYETIKAILENKKGSDLTPPAPPQNLRIE